MLLRAGAARGKHFESTSTMGKVLQFNLLCPSKCIGNIFWIWGFFGKRLPICFFLKPSRRDQILVTYIALAKVYVQRFWMLLLGSATSKPTVVFSNGSFISGLDMGPLRKKVREENTRLAPVSRGLSKMSWTPHMSWHFQSNFFQVWTRARKIPQQGWCQEVCWHGWLEKDGVRPLWPYRIQ